MKSIQLYTILENTRLTQDVWKMVLKGDTTWIEHPGQFLNITITNQYLKRPISICDWDKTTLTCVYKVVGKGTKKMAQMESGEVLECLVGLGNGFDLNDTPESLLLIGGGVGVPPIYGLAKECLRQHRQITVILGFATDKEAILVDEFKALGIKVYISTNDGSLGTQGFVSDVMKENNLLDTFYMACGPMPMLKAIHTLSHAQGLLSFEERMGCGFGACMGCSCQTKQGYKRICVEGPVLASEEVLWKD